MKPLHIVLFALIVLLLLGNTVIPDRLSIGNNPISGEIFSQGDDLTATVHAKPVTIDIKLVTLLLCVGVIGIAVLSRRRLGDKDHDKDITPR